MSNNAKRPFTCYFCNQRIVNETEMGHSTLCSKVLVPCPYKCGAYVQRADLLKHKSECNNNVRKSKNFDISQSISSNKINNTNSLDRNGYATVRPKLQDDISNLQRQFSELEMRFASSLSNLKSRNINVDALDGSEYQEVKSKLNQHALSIQKAAYFNGVIAEWKKNIDTQISTLKNSLSVIDATRKDNSQQSTYIQEKLLHLQNLQIDLSLLKETVFKENSHFRKTEMDFARNIEGLRATFKQHKITLDTMWREQTEVLQNIISDIQVVKQAIEEQKAKYAGLVFDIRSVSQISSEAAEKVEILERDFTIMKKEINQMKVNMEILEDLNCDDNISYQRLIWRLTEVETKLKRAKENDIVLKSPIFYTHRFGYKVRVLLYLNGLKKWKDRYALACLHVLKGEYDLLLTWPCTIEGNITLRDLSNTSQAKSVSKFIRTKRARGDEEEEEPQESLSTYIFIPHSVLFKENYVKDDTIFLDISIKENNLKYETSL